MTKAKLLFALLVAFIMAAPAQAVELTLGGFPSYMRTRVHVIKNGTFISAISDDQARSLGFNDADDNIVFVDTRLRLTPQLILSDSVTIRAQVDVFDNNIWGGSGLNTKTDLLRDQVFSSLTPNDRFRGAVLVNVDNVLFRGLGLNGIVTDTAVDDVQFFNVRMLHMDVVLPGNLGFIRVGRQPFDWGLGILANGGWDPNSDLGFVLDRFLYLKSWGIGDGTFTFVFVSDRFRQGNSLVTGSGDGWEGGAVALIYNVGGLTLGYYNFPYIHQTNFGGAGSDLNTTFLLHAGLIDYKTDMFRAVIEAQHLFGEITGTGGDDIDIEAGNLLLAARVEVYPGFPAKMIAIEAGYAGGDEIDPANDGGDLQGNVLAFNAAYNADNLLFKHIIPSIYGLDNSVINAFYVRGWATIKLLDNLTLTPQVLFAWNAETQALVAPGQFPGDDGEVGRFLATELEATISIDIVPGVNFDIIGSVVIPGSGLDDLFEQRAAIQVGNGAVPGNFDAPDAPFAIQGRLVIYIDQFFKK